jgi:hypothetical protein
MLSGGIAVGLVLAGIADELGGLQAVFHSAAIIFSGLSLTSGYLLYRNKEFGNSEASLTKPKVTPRRAQEVSTLHRECPTEFQLFGLDNEGFCYGRCKKDS